MKVDDWTERFQGPRSLPSDVRARLRSAATPLGFTKGEIVFSPNNTPDHLLFLVDGVLRVTQTSEGGREIVLYRVEAGESCVLTTACMLAEEAYHAEGVAESDVTAAALPKPAFDRLVAEEAAFRSLVFAAYSRRLIDLLRVVEDVAFGRIDVRLADRIVALADTNGAVEATHQDLAKELGTAREVVSRTLQDFQRRGLIAQSRGRITLARRAALEALAASD